MDLTRAEDGSLSAMSKKRWREGLWAFDTCNANAWAGTKTYMERSQADYVAVQEAKLAKTEVAGSEQTA